MRLIDADKILYFKGKDIVGEDAYMTQKDVIDEMPTVDTERHGHWEIDIDTGCEMYKCSVCECRMIKRDYDIACGTNALRYCPYCGAKMDEE